MTCLTIKNRFCIHFHWGHGGGFGGYSLAFTENERWLDKVGAVSSLSKSFVCPHGDVRIAFSSNSTFSNVYTLKPDSKIWISRNRRCLVDKRPKRNKTSAKTYFSPYSCGRHLKLEVIHIVIVGPGVGVWSGFLFHSATAVLSQGLKLWVDCSVT